jgi:NitT/TauT family transport system substrate-binding protein
MGFKKRSGAVAFVSTILATALLAACSGSGGSPDPLPADEDNSVLPIRIGYSAGPSTLPIIVAELEGFYEKHGLDAEISTVTPGPTAMQGLGRQYDVLQTSTQSVFEAAEQGLDIQIVTGMGNSTKELNAFPVFTNDESVQSWADLEGKVFGVPSLPGFATTTTLFLAGKEGADPDLIETPIVPWDTQSDQLQAGQVDAVWSVIPFSFLLESQGYRVLGDPTLEATGVDELVASVTATPTAFADSNLEALTRLKAALLEAEQWVTDNPDEAKAVVIDVLGLPEKLIMDNPVQGTRIDLGPADVSPMFVVYDELGMLQNLPPMEDLFVKF